MPKIPRDITSRDLRKLLSGYGYERTRRTGGHIRLSSNSMGYEHSTTTLEHSPTEIGTMSKIPNNGAGYLKVQKRELLDALT